MPGKLTPPSLDKPVDLDGVKRHVEKPMAIHDGATVKIPGVHQPLFARHLPDHILGFDFDHMELVPGGQVTLPGLFSLNPHLVRVRTLSASPCSRFISAVQTTAPTKL